MFRKSANGIAERGLTKADTPKMDGSTGMKKGGKVKESMMEKKMGKGMAKAKMQKVAKTAVKSHEKRMHKGAKKMAYGGMAKKMASGGRAC
jgi:hypothetical protein